MSSLAGSDMKYNDNSEDDEEEDDEDDDDRAEADTVAKINRLQDEVIHFCVFFLDLPTL